jgi:uncharacterized lipoprotein
MKLGVLGILALLLLTGCSSSASIQDQVKLIEYENCLEALRQVPYDYLTADEAIKSQDFQVSLCTKYLP